MKIAIISPNRGHLRDMAAALEPEGHRITVAEGGKSRMRSIAEEDHPDVMVVDGMCCDASEVLHIEEVTARHPSIAVILLCATQTPEFLINSMRAGVREVLPSPPSPGALQEAIARLAAKLGPARAGRRGKVVAFMSSKGGSGATFLASNLAWELSQSRSVLLVDLNLQFGDALSFLHDGVPPATIADVCRDISRLDATLLSSSAVKVSDTLGVLAAPEDLAHAMEVKPEHVAALLEVATSQYDFVLLDLARAIEPVAVRALDRCDRIYVVMQTGLPHVRNAARLLQVFRSLGYGAEKLEVLVNRFEKTSEIGLEQIRRSLGQVRVGTVPNSYREVSAAINHGDALARSARSNPVVRQLAELAAALDPRQEDSRGLLDRLFRRA